MKELVQHKPFILNSVIEAHATLTAHLKQSIDRLNGAEESPDIFSVVQDVCLMSRDFAQAAHKLKMAIDWGVPPNPEWFDHYCDVYFQLREQRTTFWMERGVYGRLPFMRVDRAPRVLELCCGDGFNTNFMYSPYAASVLALDFDAEAINHANSVNSAKNVTYRNADIRYDFPDEAFDNVVWDAAIEHFTETEISSILTMIVRSLGSTGILSGYTLVEQGDGTKHIQQHEREMKSKRDLLELLRQHFNRCVVFETFSAERHNLYFYASNGAALPFDDDWKLSIAVHL